MPEQRRRRPRTATITSLPATRARVLVRARDAIAEWAPRGICRAQARQLDGSDLVGRRAVTGQFFPTRHSTPADVTDAKAVCASCPVRPECLAYALVNWEKVGIWGGETEDERRRSRRKMRAAGIRKDLPRALEWVLDYLFPTTPEETNDGADVTVAVAS